MENINQDFFTEFRSIMLELQEIDFESDKDCDAVGEIEDKLNEWGCKAFNSHRWVYDHCGYWQHKFCEYCGKPQYEDLCGQRCSVLIEDMGNMTEEEYISQNTASANSD